LPLEDNLNSEHIYSGTIVPKVFGFQASKASSTYHTTMTYTLRTGCTIEDAEGVAKNNVPAFWSNTWWRILYDAPAERVLEVVTLRTPWNLLSENEVKRHQVVVDDTTGDIVGYARWMLPTKHQKEWLEAKTPEPSKEEIQRFKDLSDNNRLPHGDPQFKREMDALDDPIEKAEADFAPKKPYISKCTTTH
jgi:hypothetical protein